MSFGFPPRYSCVLELNLPAAELNAMVDETLAELGWKYYRENTNRVIARVNTEFGWGGWEAFIVDVWDGKIETKSQGFLPVPFFDFGKNRNNVERFLSALSLKSIG